MSSLAVAPAAVQHDQHVKEHLICGGWVPIKDPNDPHVRDIGDWAVREFDKEKGTLLKFICVLSGETQVVAGVNYRLVLFTENCANSTRKYQAVVYERAWENFRKLVSFKPLLD